MYSIYKFFKLNLCFNGIIFIIFLTENEVPTIIMPAGKLMGDEKRNTSILFGFLTSNDFLMSAARVVVLFYMKLTHDFQG